jgi:carboxypeptidase D
VIDRTGNVIIAHGMLDFLLIANGSLISIQNMTWNGLQGFQTSPSAVNNFYVPYHYGSAEAAEVSTGTWTNDAGAGILGKTHEERGLTFVTINLAGHGESPVLPSGVRLKRGVSIY